MKITTLRTTNDCPDINTCPSEHAVDTDPRNLYVIAKKATSTEAAVLDASLRPGQLSGWMPAGFLPDGHPALIGFSDPRLRVDRQYVALTVVDDADTLTEFARLTAADEFLGTVPISVEVAHA